MLNTVNKDMFKILPSSSSEASIQLAISILMKSYILVVILTNE